MMLRDTDNDRVGSVHLSVYDSSQFQTDVINVGEHMPYETWAWNYNPKVSFFNSDDFNYGRNLAFLFKLILLG